jgi:hypothetical protein
MQNFYVEKLPEGWVLYISSIGCLVDQDVGGWIIIKLILERWDGVVWTGLIWLRIGTSARLL